MTDGDPQMYGPLRALQQLKDLRMGEHVLCKWHLLVVSWHESVSLSIPKNEACKELGNIAYGWIQSWFWYIEILIEFDVSLQSFWTWEDTTHDVQEEFSVPKLKIRDFILVEMLWVSKLIFEAKTTPVCRRTKFCTQGWDCKSCK